MNTTGCFVLEVIRDFLSVQTFFSVRVQTCFDTSRVTTVSKWISLL